MADEWREYFSQTNTRRSNAVDERDQKQDALENTAMKSISLQDYLLGQLSMAEIDDSLLEISRNIIYNINDSGYLSDTLEEISKTLENPVSIETAKKALKVVQSMEPPGVGARNLKECLLLQLDQRDANYNTARELISNHLEDVEMKKYKLIAKKSGFK